MTEEILAVPSADEGSYVKLARSQQGQLFRKKILPMNKSFVHPGDHKTNIFITPEIAASLVKNFGNNLVEHVQTTVVNKDNQHTEDPRDNVGEVIGLDYDDNGVYATIDARKHADEFGKTFLDSSAFLHMDYADTDTGDRVGPTLLHVAVTNRGHVRNMGDYEKVIKASADNHNDKILFLSEAEAEPKEKATPPVVEPQVVTETPEEENKPMTKEELIAALKENPGVAQEFLKANDNIDVEALQVDSTKVAELSAQLDEVNQKLELSGAEVSDIEDLAKSYVTLSESHKSLQSDIDALKLSNQQYAQRDAENEVDGLVRVGKVLPAQRDVMVRLSMSDRETFDALVPENPIVKLSETGTTIHEEPNAAQFDEDIKRYKDLAVKLSGRNN